MLSQPFTITDQENPIAKEKPLCGGSYKSSFQQKFRLSTTFDIVKTHEWTLNLYENNEKFTIESIYRDREEGTLRFWKKGKRGAGSGYIQLPVIFLSLNRLMPLGEDSKLIDSNKIALTEEEKEFYSIWYNKILISDDNITKVDYLTSQTKDTLGVTTDYYDWNSNSAGQDNLGKILLAIISFKRLKAKYNGIYKGGILAIDEIDATLYPGAQIKLIKALSTFCSKYSIQLIATSHSLAMLEQVINTQDDPTRKNQARAIYLKKKNNLIQVENSISFQRITNHLNASLGTQVKHEILIFTEDKECIEFTKSILGRKYKYLNFIDTTFGCGNLIELGRKKVRGFTSDTSIIVLDGDVNINKISKFNNFIKLPGDKSPEQLLATFLQSLDDESPFWTEKNQDYSKQICFSDYSVLEIMKCREKSKRWYREQKDTDVWGRGCSLAFKYLLGELEAEKLQFIKKFDEIYRRVAHNQSIPLD